MTNISKPKAANNSDFVEGDTVVFIDPSKPDHLMTVFQVQKNGVLLNGNNSFALNHLIRHATAQELSLKRRVICDIAKHLEAVTNAQKEVS
ncbi:hypothetical protein MMO39_04685 [Acinetobacter modestus]|uniref:hypothetical protein n=1 Tax=Acinetobacter modestus TaxID=1776740 RepID=UPI001F4A5691|nr:hypothetical protein [Acinetobacter modestus]MCH7386597.1 hypothetical protein [Acinetobacter modestus]